MKIIISKATLQTISTNIIPAALSIANVAREVNSIKKGFTSSFDKSSKLGKSNKAVPSNEEIMSSFSNLDFNILLLITSKAVEVSMSEEDVIIGINDEYITKATSLVSGFYGALAAPALNVAKALIPVATITKQFVEDSQALDAEWLSTDVAE